MADVGVRCRALLLLQEVISIIAGEHNESVLY